MTTMMWLLLNVRVSISNGLCTLAAWADDRGHRTAAERIRRARGGFDASACRALGHPRVLYGVMRDICLDCLAIVDEHPRGRNR